MKLQIFDNEIAEDYCENGEIRCLEQSNAVGYIKMRIANIFWLQYHGEYDNSIELSYDGFNRNAELSEIRYCREPEEVIRLLFGEDVCDNEVERESYFNVFKGVSMTEDKLVVDNDGNFYLIDGYECEEEFDSFSFITDKEKYDCLSQIEVETIVNDAQTMDFNSYKAKYYDSWDNDAKLL